MSAALLRWLDRVGPRGFGMVVLAPFWAVIGVGVYADHFTTLHDAFHLLIPAHWRGIAWVITGVVAAVASHCRRFHWLGILALSLMPIMRFTSFGLAWLIWLFDDMLPGDSAFAHGDPQGLFSCAPWGIAVLAVLGLTFLVGDSWGFTIRAWRQMRHRHDRRSE